jgi:hypothetical protein
MRPCGASVTDLAAGAVRPLEPSVAAGRLQVLLPAGTPYCSGVEAGLGQEIGVLSAGTVPALRLDVHLKIHDGSGERAVPIVVEEPFHDQDPAAGAARLVRLAQQIQARLVGPVRQDVAEGDAVTLRQVVGEEIPGHEVQPVSHPVCAARLSQVGLDRRQVEHDHP